jgi:hypothetical protein
MMLKASIPPFRHQRSWTYCLVPVVPNSPAVKGWLAAGRYDRRGGGASCNHCRSITRLKFMLSGRLRYGYLEDVVNYLRVYFSNLDPRKLADVNCLLIVRSVQFNPQLLRCVDYNRRLSPPRSVECKVPISLKIDTQHL